MSAPPLPIFIVGDTGRRVTAMTAEALFTAPEVVVPRPLPTFGGLPIHPLNLIPDWIDTIELETTWLTDVVRSIVDGSRDHRALITRPSRTLTATITGRTNAETHILAQSLMGYAHASAPVAIYCDQAVLTGSEVLSSKTNLLGDFRFRRFFLGQRVLIVKTDPAVKQSDNFAQWGEIETVSNYRIVLKTQLARAPAPGELVFPCMDVEVVPESTGTFEVDNVLKVRLSWEETRGPESLPATHPPLAYDALRAFVGYTEDGVPIFDLPPDWSNGIEVTVRRDIEQQPTERGGVTTPVSYPYHLFAPSILASDREQAWDAIRFFDAMQGRAGLFYLLNPSDPWTLWAPLPLNNTTSCNIDAVASHEEILLHFTHVALYHSDGRIFVRKLDDVDDLSTHYRLTWSDPLPNTSFVRVRPIHLSSLEKDTLNETWTTDGVMTAKIGIQEVRTFADSVTPTSESLLHFDAYRIKTAITLADPHLWFEAGANNFTLDPEGTNTFRLCDIFPSRDASVSRMFDVREKLPSMCPPGLRFERPFLQANGAVFATALKFVEVWQNGNSPVVMDPNHDLSLQTIAIDPNTPATSRHLWDPAVGWTLILAVSPFSTVRTPGVESNLVEIRDAAGIIFSLCGAHYQGGAITAIGFNFRDGGGTPHLGLVNGGIANNANTQIIVIRWDAVLGRMWLHINGQNREPSSSFYGISAFFQTSGYTLSRWGQMFNYQVGGSTPTAASWGIKGGLNAVLNFRRPLSADEVNNICTELATSYNGAWSPLSYP